MRQLAAMAVLLMLTISIIMALPVFASHLSQTCSTPTFAYTPSGGTTRFGFTGIISAGSHTDEIDFAVVGLQEGIFRATLDGPGGTDFDLFIYSSCSNPLPVPFCTADGSSTYKTCEFLVQPERAGARYYFKLRAESGTGQYNFLVERIGTSVSCNEATCNASDYFESSWNYYCSSSERWQQRLFHDYGCQNNSCVEIGTQWRDQSRVETCSVGCRDGVCVSAACRLDGDCPDRYSGGNYCSGNNVVLDRQRGRCLSPGTMDARCDFYSAEQRLVESCSYGCSNGSCVTPRCSTNADCGGQGYVNDPYCSSGNIYRTYRTPTCRNSGTGSAFCENVDSGQLQQVCSAGCSNGVCIVPLCNRNSDCGTDSYVGDRTCSGSNVVQNYHRYTCNSPGSASANCSSGNEIRTIETCRYGCTGGACNSPRPDFTVNYWDIVVVPR